jgi:hypothetical protein
MRGTKSAPTTKQLYRARLQFRVIPVDEYGSSKACHCCENVICAVRRVTDDKGKKSTREIRGLRYCSNSRKFYDRDFNAAVNILRFSATGARPVAMMRRDASSELNDGEKSAKIAQKNVLGETSIVTGLSGSERGIVSVSCGRHPMHNGPTILLDSKKAFIVLKTTLSAGLLKQKTKTKNKKQNVCIKKWSSRQEIQTFSALCRPPPVTSVSVTP